jgi:hypothetical protein
MTRYEVRKPDGKILGKLDITTAKTTGELVLAVAKPPTFYRMSQAPDTNIIVDEVRLLITEARIGALRIPTLILLNGKVTWLRKYPGFKRTL